MLSNHKKTEIKNKLQKIIEDLEEILIIFDVMIIEDLNSNNLFGLRLIWFSNIILASFNR